MYMYIQEIKKREKLLRINESNLRTRGTHKHREASLKYLDNHSYHNVLIKLSCVCMYLSSRDLLICQ